MHFVQKRLYANATADQVRTELKHIAMDVYSSAEEDAVSRQHALQVVLDFLPDDIADLFSYISENTR